ncbi:MAG: hypothetical protein H6977_01155 [Gammaproteobacteria bacterium]|nr:hypothetical protein [Gammaproteobacteria bacterium]MCP5198587.1 hypothetical protein [Gammaproteobacteria bacterium]
MQQHKLPAGPGGPPPMMPNPGAYTDPERLDDIHNDFIPHPAQFPLRYRRRSALPWRHKESSPVAGDVGLSFHSPKYVPAGTRLDLEIPLRGVTQRFTATVVLVREVDGGFELGLWFASSDDASRARIVEKICHTECYLRARRERGAN